MNYLMLSVMTAVLITSSATAAERVKLSELVASAIEHDPLVQESAALARAARSEAIAAGELPDPVFSLSVANMPADTLDFSQEPMTQVKLGLSQAFPGRKTRTLSRERFELLGLASEVEQAIRRAQVQREVTADWLRLRQARLSIAAIEEERQLFNKLVATTRSSYENAAARVNQQDLIRAELELSRLDERVLKLEEEADRAIEKLSVWVPRRMLSADFDWSPVLEVPGTTSLLAHPEVVYLNQQVSIASNELALADESRRPGYKVSASYGYRDEDFNGRDLPDFVSVGFSMNLPLFRASRQDRRVAAAADRRSAVESARTWKLRELKSRRSDAHAALRQLSLRRELYEETLLTRYDALANAAIDAYSADRGDFADVMRAYIARLGARIELLGIETEQANVRSELIYLTATVIEKKEAS